MEIQIITPPIADERNLLHRGLTTLTEAISQISPADVAHGALGGPFGYGADYENDVFMMHHFCWCEREDCRWCSDDACGCDHPAPREYIDGAEVTAEESYRRNQEFLGKMPHELYGHNTPEYIAYSKEWDARVVERNRRWKRIFPARIHCCKPRGMMADRPEGEDWRPNQSAPNFWHKASGLRVWWYKWIGRDMETTMPDGLDINAVFAECLALLPKRQPLDR